MFRFCRQLTGTEVCEAERHERVDCDAVVSKLCGKLQASAEGCYGAYRVAETDERCAHALVTFGLSFEIALLLPKQQRAFELSHAGLVVANGVVK